MVLFPKVSVEKVYLGSESSSRKQLVQSMNVEFECYPAKLDEKSFGDRENETPEHLVELLGRAKADFLRNGALSGKKGVLLTGDQVVVINGKICEKPDDVAQALQYIGEYSNHFCSTVGSVVVTDLESGKQLCEIERCDIHFKEIPAADREAALEGGKGDIMWCAGALMIENPFIEPHITKKVGNDESIRGFGTETVAKLVSQLYGQ